MLEIDGSIGEGGGQVLRTALALSCIKGQPVRISSIRAGRETPGLKAQHLAVCRLLAEISGAKMEGAVIGSTEITFLPGKISGGNYRFDIGTAGSCTLFLSAALPVLMFAEKKSSLEITGGTHVAHSPTFEYFSEVFLPAARKFGAEASAKMERAGFYPKGGGKVLLEVEPSTLKGCEFAPQADGTVHYSIISSSIPLHVAAREEEIVKKEFPGAQGKAQALDAACAGNAVTLWKGFSGASSLGERGKPADAVAKEACSALKGELAAGASVDSHLADQLLIYAALSGGKSKYFTPHATSHLKTNAEIIRAFIKRNISLGSKGLVEID